MFTKIVAAVAIATRTAPALGVWLWYGWGSKLRELELLGVDGEMV